MPLNARKKEIYKNSDFGLFFPLLNLTLKDLNYGITDEKQSNGNIKDRSCEIRTLTQKW